MVEDAEDKKVWILDMAFQKEINKEIKKNEKLNKYSQLAFEMREKRYKFQAKIIPVIIRCPVEEGGYLDQ